MDQELNQEILDKLTKVCLCKGISRATMKKAIAGGADTVEKVRKATGAGSGSCGGRRCTPKIEELLTNVAEKNKKKILQFALGKLQDFLYELERVAFLRVSRTAIVSET